MKKNNWLIYFIDLNAVVVCLALSQTSFFATLIGLVIYFALRPKIKKALFRKKEVIQGQAENSSSINDEIFDAFKELGNTPEDRKKSIEEIFSDPDTTFFFAGRYEFVATTRTGGIDRTWGPFTKYHEEGTRRNYEGFVEIRIFRNLVTMEPKEKELLRAAFLLYNEGLIDAEDYRLSLFSFVNGNGKAAIEYYKYKAYEEEGIKDGASCVKYFQDKNDASVESASNHLLAFIKNQSLKSGSHSLISTIQSRLVGGSSWLRPEEIEGSIFNGKSNYQLSLGNLDEGNAVLHYSGEGSLITIAPPGSGKTQCFVLPNLLSWKGASVVLDIKGDIFKATSNWREKNVGKVYKFSPLDPANSNNYNPLTFVRQDADYIWEDSRFLADMMIVPSGGNDPFWENMARDVLTSAIAYVTFYNEPENRPMSKVLDIVYGIGWNEMISALRTNVMVSAMRQTGHALGEMENKMKDSVLKTAQSSLSAWQGERIGKVTRKSDWNPLDLRKENATVYICLTPNEIDSFLSVLRVFIAQHIRMLTTEIPARGSAPVLFMLDELPRLKKMPPIDEALNIGRQYGIKLWMFAQTYGQLKEAYPNAEGLLGSCAVRTFMDLPIHDELTTKISEQLGFREGPLDISKQKLVEPADLAGPRFKDLILVLATSTKPAKVRKKMAYQDAEFVERMKKAI